MSESTKGTNVDLGDDLLQTRTIAKDPARAEAERLELSESIEELLINSKILVAEGLLEDAKKTLRRVLRLDPPNLSARERLEEIQKIEIKRLLGQDDGQTGGGFLKAKKKKADPITDDGDLVCAALERELGTEPTPELRFFQDETERDAFLKRLDQLGTTIGCQDRIDLGIGFLEMELYEAAIHLFRSVVAEVPSERRGRALLATAWVAKGNGFEAMIELETLVADQSAPPEEKVDYGYLAGRAQEILGKYETAVHWYRAVLQIEPHYRDTEDRLRRSLKMSSSRA